MANNHENSHAALTVELTNGVDVELRDIEIFLTLAEELHFGRTAQRLHVTPARITQAIKKQERQIGAPLFDRTSRRVRLTPLGEQFRDDLLPVYTALGESIERAKMPARGILARLRVGLMPFNLGHLHPYWKTFRARHPQWELQIRRAPVVDPFSALRDGCFDVLVAWLPVEEPDLTIGPVLFTDDRVLAVAADHELAQRDSVSVEMFADFSHLMPPRMPYYWEDRYLPFRTPRGRTIERGEHVSSVDEAINMITTGEGIHAFPAHVTEYWATPHIRWLPVPDLSPLPYALVWRMDVENDLIRALVRVVRDLGSPAS